MSEPPTFHDERSIAAMRRLSEYRDQPDPEPEPYHELEPARCPTSGCILWEGRTSMGYGVLSRRGVPIRAHRVAWIEAHGEIPKGAIIHHACHNKLCVNVAHLQLVSSNSEHARMHHKPQERCETCGSDSFYVRKSGKRWCRNCRNLRERSAKYRTYQNSHRNQRFASDPEYRERLRAQWRASGARKREHAKAANA